MKGMIKTVVALLAVAGAGTAWAGIKNVIPVTVNVANKQATGSMGSARNSADAVQYIGCYLVTDIYFPEAATCTARDAAGNSLSCTTQNSKLLSLLRTMAGDSWINFQADSAGQCILLQINNYSFYEPKK